MFCHQDSEMSGRVSKYVNNDTQILYVHWASQTNVDYFVRKMHGDGKLIHVRRVTVLNLKIILRKKNLLVW